MKHYPYIILLILSLSESLHAQTLQGLQENAVIKNEIAHRSPQLKSSQGVLLTLPFFEDFSTSSVFPDPAKWSDRYAFVNNSFGLNPVSIGVATMDAIDENGDVYSVNNNPVSSDMLTTQSFDISMFKNTGTVVRLSFFYQCGGNGDTPDEGDSLLLEYFSPAMNRWYLAWYSNNHESSEFTQVILNVPDSLYQLGFRFRFRNWTSISIQDVSGGRGALSNADVWNIDYIMMNTEPLFAHQVLNDIALTDVPRRMLDLYETIPWAHLNIASPVIGRNNMNYDIRNMMQKGSTTNTGRSYYTRDLTTGFRENYDVYYQEFPNDSLIHITDPFFAPFINHGALKQGAIEVVSYLDTPAGQNKYNDTSRVVLHFTDAYVYDDGTPEYGFGIEGPSMDGALLALKFRLFKPDTLRAVDMYFNKARDNFNDDLEFKLCVWKDAGGKPGDLLYISEENFTPEFAGGKPGFTRYPVTPMLISDSVVYVGWKQLTEEFLNLGYDVNRNNLSRTFVNTAGSWINPGASLIHGTVMMRAVVGDKDVVTQTPQLPAEDEGLIIYPNPVGYTLNIGPENVEFRDLKIMDLSGRVLIHVNGAGRQIDVSSLSPGLYHVMIETGNQKTVIRKMIVSR